MLIGLVLEANKWFCAGKGFVDLEFTAAIFKRDDLTCVVVIVKKEVIKDKFEAEQACQVFSKIFPLMPVVLMAQDFRGDGIFYGPQDIVRVLSRIKPEHMPWKKYSIKD